MAIKTRIQLRNDQLSNWQGSQKPLLRGEVALARLSGELSDKYQIRIGTGDKTWDQLSSSNFMIPAENVEGLNDSIKSVQTKFYEVSAYTELPENTDVTKGSVGVVLETLSAEGKDDVEFRTAYWFDTELTSETHPNGTWRQLDGNYKADEVYFTDNMQLTYTFGKYAPKNGNFTLSCKNMSLHEVIQDAFAQTKAPVVTQPTFSFSAGGDRSGEIGTDYTIPAATFKMTDDGSYEYGPDPTGVKVSSGDVTITPGTTTGIAAKTSTSDILSGDTLTTDSGATKQYAVAAVTYTYSCTYSYTDGVEPKTNVGTLSADAKIVGKSETKPTSAKFTGIAPTFMYASSGTSTMPTAITANDATAINLTQETIEGKKVSSVAKLAADDKWYKYVNTTVPTTFYFGAGSYQNFYVAVPASKGYTSWTGKKSNNVNSVNTVAAVNATVTFKDGTEVAYKVFPVTNAIVFNDYAAFMTYA